MRTVAPFVIAVFAALPLRAEKLAPAANSAPQPQGSGPATSGASPTSSAPISVSDKGTTVNFEALRRAVVLVERGGHPVGIGTVLAGDGRIMTALSSLGRATEIVEVRYADGRVAKAKIGHKDRQWDLALLVPQSRKWTDGLAASEADPQSTEVKWLFPGAAKIAPVAHVRGRVHGTAQDGAPLPSLIDVDLRGLHPLVGAPLIDTSGAVVGMFARLCKGDEADAGRAKSSASGGGPADKPCASMSAAVPIATLRSFLAKTPSDAMIPTPWLGIVGQSDTAGSTRGVRVVQIAPASPAEKAGLRAAPGKGHLIVAVDGWPVDTPEKLADRIGKYGVDETIKLLLLEDEKLKQVDVRLRAAGP